MPKFRKRTTSASASGISLTLSEITTFTGPLTVDNSSTSGDVDRVIPWLHLSTSRLTDIVNIPMPPNDFKHQWISKDELLASIECDVSAVANAMDALHNSASHLDETITAAAREKITDRPSTWIASRSAHSLILSTVRLPEGRKLPSSVLCASLSAKRESTSPPGVFLRWFCGYSKESTVEDTALNLYLQLVTVGTISEFRRDPSISHHTTFARTLRALACGLGAQLYQTPIYCFLDAVDQYVRDPSKVVAMHACIHEDAGRDCTSAWYSSIEAADNRKRNECCIWSHADDEM